MENEFSPRARRAMSMRFTDELLGDLTGAEAPYTTTRFDGATGGSDRHSRSCRTQSS